MTDVEDPLVTIARLAREHELIGAELERAVALAQANGVGVRKLGEALGASKSTAAVIAQRGRAKLDDIPCP